MNDGIPARSIAQGYARGRQHIRTLLDEQRAETAPTSDTVAPPGDTNAPMHPTGLRLHELPEPMLHTALIELARVFCRRLGRPRANDLELAGFTDLADLLMRGWILREPGRYSIGYMPGQAVIREMWLIDPALCTVLNLKRPAKA
jgi:hypothetical protein